MVVVVLISSSTSEDIIVIMRDNARSNWFDVRSVLMVRSEVVDIHDWTRLILRTGIPVNEWRFHMKRSSFRCINIKYIKFRRFVSSWHLKFEGLWQKSCRPLNSQSVWSMHQRMKSVTEMIDQCSNYSPRILEIVCVAVFNSLAESSHLQNAFQ